MAENNLRKKLVHLLTNMVPFVAIYFISPHIEYQDYDFLYRLAQRNFWYAWLIPALLILAGCIKWAYVYTASTVSAMIYGQYYGDILYRLDKLDGFYPHTPHWGIWIVTKLKILAVIIFIRLVVNYKKVIACIKQTVTNLIRWWNVN